MLYVSPFVILALLVLMAVYPRCFCGCAWLLCAIFVTAFWYGIVVYTRTTISCILLVATAVFMVKCLRDARSALPEENEL